MAWELFTRDSRGYEVVGVDGSLLDDAPLHGLPIACEVTIVAASALPDVLDETEMAIEQLVAATGGRLAGTTRSTTRLWNLVMLPDADRVADFGSIPLPGHAESTIESTEDPEWMLFDLLRPVGMEQQSMEDLRVVRRLHEHGDVGGKRPVVHVVRDLPAGSLQEFVASMRALGYTTEVGGDDLGVLVIQHADPSKLTVHAWTIRRIADRVGASYDGWRCEVVRTPPRRRRGVRLRGRFTRRGERGSGVRLRGRFTRRSERGSGVR